MTNTIPQFPPRIVVWMQDLGDGDMLVITRSHLMRGFLYVATLCSDQGKQKLLTYAMRAHTAEYLSFTIYVRDDYVFHFDESRHVIMAYDDPETWSDQHNLVLHQLMSMPSSTSPEASVYAPFTVIVGDKK